jgi:hypothetical protein
MTTLDSVIRRNDDIAWRVIEGEALVVDSRNSLIYPLNAVATRIWESLDGQRNCRDVLAIIDDEFEDDSETHCQDILEFIEEVVSKGLASPCD